MLCVGYMYMYKYILYIHVQDVFYTSMYLYTYRWAASVTNAVEWQEEDLEERARDVACRLYIYI